MHIASEGFHPNTFTTREAGIITTGERIGKCRCLRCTPPDKPKE